MRAASFAALGLAAYGVFLLATIPAAYVAAQVEAAMPRQIAFTEARGTLWQGSARAQVVPSRGGPVIDRVEWRFRPLRLAAGEVAFATKLSTGSLAASAEVARAPSQWRLTDLKVEGDASTVAILIPVFAAWRPSGAVTVTSPSLTIRDGQAQGSLDAEWRGAVSGLSDVRPLGSYRASWRAESGKGGIAVTTLQGPLRITGAGTMTPPARIAFSGEARAEGEAAKALEPLLDLMGPRRPDGARALEIRID